MKSGTAVVGGGLVSLFLCGQFGVAMTPLARGTHHLLHDHFNSLACALVCGFLFAALPAVALRLMCRGVEFRAIVRQAKAIPVVWLLGFGGLLAYHGEHGKELIELAAWAVAALGTFRLLAAFIDRVGARRVALTAS